MLTTCFGTVLHKKVCAAITAHSNHNIADDTVWDDSTTATDNTDFWKKGVQISPTLLTLEQKS